MPGYRLYFYEDGPDGHHIRHRIEFDCPDDDEALRKAEGHAGGHHMELWRGARMLRSWPKGRGS